MATVSQHAHEDAPWRTHTVANQPPPLVGLDVFASNLPLVEATEREGAGWIAERASALGLLVGEEGGPQEIYGADSRTRTSRCSTPTTATATGSTRSSSTPPGTS